jgi:hypothetical protein
MTAFKYGDCLYRPGAEEDGFWAELQVIYAPFGA